MPETATFLKIKNQILRLARNDRFQRLAFTGVLFLASILILGYLVFKERNLLLEYRWEFNVIPAIISFPLYTIALLTIVGIWGWMMNTLSKKLSFATHFRYFAVSNVAKRLPGTIWYIASRAHFYRAEGIDPKLTSLASGMELLVSTIASILVSLVFSFTLLTESRSNLLTVTGLFIICGLLLHPRTFTWVGKLLKVEIAQLRYFTILKWIGLYCFNWIVAGCLLFTIGSSITPLPVWQLPYFIGSFSVVGALSTVVFFLPSNFGITEVGLSLFLSRILPAHVAVAIAVSFRLLVTFYDVIWAGICWKTLPRSRIKP